MKMLIFLLLMLAADKVVMAKGDFSVLKHFSSKSGGNGLHGQRHMPPIGENTEKRVLAKGGVGIRQMPAIGLAEGKRQLVIGPHDDRNRLTLRDQN